MKYIPMMFSTLLLLACGSDKQSVEEVTTLSYEIKTFIIESKDGCETVSKPCAKFEVSYPVFTGPEGSRIPYAVEDRINTMLAAPTSDLDPESIEAAGKAFISDFEMFVQDFPDVNEGWYYIADVVVENFTDKILCLSVNDEYYTGGAHGGSGSSFINFNAASGIVMVLDDLLKPGYEGDLTKAGERAFRLARNISTDVNLADEGFEFEGGYFHLNENYGFRPEGIVFFYNIYEIGPYVLGPTEILIPYEEIKDWLIEESEPINL
jgi:hypothetical protein